MGFFPTRAETASLKFLVPLPGFWLRYGIATIFFAGGAALAFLGDSDIAVFGPLVALVGHLPLFVRRQTTAPGGATPEHEDVWAPTEDNWFDQIIELENKAARWDASLWDITNWRGVLMLVTTVVLGFVAAATISEIAAAPGEIVVTLMAALTLPIWVNGMKRIWHPSELKLKGASLEIARGTAQKLVGDTYDAVPLLALREGRNGKYPVDARLMLRPAKDDGSGFIGVQVQVALNNVQGTDYPYLYCVVLGKQGFKLPESRASHLREGRTLSFVFERDSGDDVDYLVVRQHADNSGGWHTEASHVQELVEVALEEAERARAPGARKRL